MQNTDVAEKTLEDDSWGACIATPADGSSQFPVPSPAPTGYFPPPDDAIGSFATLGQPTNRKRRSYVWDPTNGHEYTRDGMIRWRCSRCPDRDTAPSFAVTTTKNAIMHLRDVHRIGRNGQLPEVTAEEERIRQAFGKAVPRVSFNRTVFRQMLIRWVTAYNIPFRGVDNDAFRLLLGYLAACSANYTAIPRLMPTTGKTVRAWILEKYTSSRDALRTALTNTPAAIHISFEPWTSSNQRSFLAIFGHYVELATGESRDVLLGFRRLHGPHSGENQADCIWQVAVELGITRKLGYFTTDNASSNDNVLQYIAEKSSHIGVTFDPVSRRIRCFGHILNQVGKAFLWGDNPVAIDDHLDKDDDPEAQVEVLRAWRKTGPLGRLHNCIRHILKTPQRRERFQEKARTYNLEGVALDLIIGDDTCWSDDLAALSRALLLRDPMEDFLSSAICVDRKRDEASLVHDELSPQDWDVLRTMIELLEPFKKWMILLQRKGAAARLSDIVPAYDELLSHLETQRERHSAADASIHILTSLNAAWILLNKYYAKLDDSPAYYASVALNPEMKFDYFEQEWGKWPDWIKKAKNDVVRLWEAEYKEKPQWMFTGITPGTPDCDSDIRAAPAWRQKKRARLAREEGDAMERFQQDSYIEMDDDAGPTGYWFRAAAGKLPYGGALAHMGLELSSIPAMCTEAERVFNGGEHTISDPSAGFGDDMIEATECLKSWSAGELIFGTGTEVEQMEKLLLDLQRRAEQLDE